MDVRRGEREVRGAAGTSNEAGKGREKQEKREGEGGREGRTSHGGTEEITGTMTGEVTSAGCDGVGHATSALHSITARQVKVINE